MTTALMMVVPATHATFWFNVAMFLPIVVGLLLHTRESWTSDPRRLRVLGGLAVAAVLAVGTSELAAPATNFMMTCSWWWC